MPIGVIQKAPTIQSKQSEKHISSTTIETDSSNQKTVDKTKQSSSFLGSVNYATTKVIKKVSEVATNPTAVKKVLQITLKSSAAYDLIFDGVIRDTPMTDAMKSAVRVIGFYSLYKDVVFWINPFSKETLDKKALFQSFRTAMAKSADDSSKPIESTEEVVQRIFDEIMEKEAYYSRDEVREALRNKLLARNIEVVKVDEIVKGVTVRQKSRPITLIIAAIFFTIVDVLENIATLGKWGILQLSKIAAELGKFPVFGFVMKVSLDTVIGIFASAALLITFGKAIYRTVKNAMKICQNPDPAKLEKAYKKLRTAILDMISSFTDLIYSAVPLLFSVNPALLVAFALISKGTGLVCMLIK